MIDVKGDDDYEPDGEDSSTSFLSIGDDGELNDQDLDNERT